jgi:PTS system mannose-specific IIA component
MIRVLVVTHGSSATAMLEAARRLVGDDAVVGFEALEIDGGADKPTIASRLGSAVARLADGGLVVAVDMFGSTPSNCAVELARGDARLVVLGGVNLPMLVKLATAVRDATTTAAALAQLAAETAVRSIRLEKKS